MGFPEVIQYFALGHSKATYCPAAIFAFCCLIWAVALFPTFLGSQAVLCLGHLPCLPLPSLRGAAPVENPSSREKPLLHHPSWMWLLWFMELHAALTFMAYFICVTFTKVKTMADQFCSRFCKLHEALLCFFSSKKAEQF